MWIVAIAWMYVALMMSLAEATSTQGSWLGAVITFIFYGVAPLSLVMYLLGTPARRRALRRAEQAQPTAAPAREASPASSAQADRSSLPAGDAIAAEGKEP